MRKKLQQRLRRNLIRIKEAVQRHSDNLEHADPAMSDIRYAHYQLDILLENVTVAIRRLLEDKLEFPLENGFGDDESIFGPEDDDDDDDETPTGDIVVLPVESD